MNIFFIDQSPEQAAKWMVNSHVVKMILESAQLLSTAHRLLDGKETIVYINNRKVKRWILPDTREQYLNQVTHINHPCSKWVRETSDNYYWLFDHLVALEAEYRYRYGKIHATEARMPWLKLAPDNINAGLITTPPCAMPEEFKIGTDPVQNYRQYYRVGKSHLHKWKNRDKPAWIDDDIRIFQVR